MRGVRGAWSVWSVERGCGAWSVKDAWGVKRGGCGVCGVRAVRGVWGARGERSAEREAWSVGCAWREWCACCAWCAWCVRCLQGVRGVCVEWRRSQSMLFYQPSPAQTLKALVCTTPRHPEHNLKNQTFKAHVCGTSLAHLEHILSTSRTHLCMAQL